MSRADRIVNRRSWFASIGSWYRAAAQVRAAAKLSNPAAAAKAKEGMTRKSYRRWVLEWNLFKTHDNKKVNEGMARMLNEREAKRAAREAAISSEAR